MSEAGLGHYAHAREIAAAFLVPEATMAQRISRAKAKIKASGEPSAPHGVELQPKLHPELSAWELDRS